ERHRGLRLVRTQSAFEALVWAIIGQQITLTFAFRLKSALVRTYGQSLNLDGTEYWAFPSPEPLAEADQAALAASGLGRRKAATITNVAQLVASGALDLEGLRLLPREEAIARLVELPGIGPWTAAYTLLRGLGDAGVCPVSDLGLRAAVGRLYGAGSTATVAEVAALSERWGEWRGYAAFYLWNALAERAG
ncbi:MAG: DNA-3-methyladenine glycosylase family protein, partial [Dehalococcoidia bacterium]